MQSKTAIANGPIIALAGTIRFVAPLDPMGSSSPILIKDPMEDGHLAD